MKIRPFPWYLRGLDVLLAPFMWLFAGFHFELPQETHRWHNKRLSREEVSSLDDSMMVEAPGRGSSPWDYNSYGLLHLPILGGWKHYLILETEGSPSYWHIGWIGGIHNSYVQRLPIHGKQIKMLYSPEGTHVRFFAIDEAGRQIALTKVGEGVLGDGRYRATRLF